MIKSKLLIAVTCALTAGLALSAAAFSGGNGTENNPYQVANVQDLEELASLSGTETLEGK